MRCEARKNLICFFTFQETIFLLISKLSAPGFVGDITPGHRPNNRGECMKRTVVFTVCASVLLLGMGAFAQKPMEVRAMRSSASVTVPDLAPFTKVSVMDDIDVEFVQAAQTSATVYGAANLVELVDIDVVNGVLQVKFSQPVRVRGENRLEVLLTGPSLEKVSVQNGGEFEAEGMLNVADLELQAADQGEISLGTVQAGTVNVQASGRGEADISYLTANAFTAVAQDRAEVEVSGVVPMAELTNNGAGKIAAQHLRATAVTAVVNGAGDIKCRPVKTLTAHVSGSGKIIYKGFPSVLTNTGKTRKIVQD